MLDGLETYATHLGQPKRAFEYATEKINLLSESLPPLRILVVKAFSVELWGKAGKTEEALEMLNSIAAHIQPPFDQITAFGYLLFILKQGNQKKRNRIFPR